MKRILTLAMLLAVLAVTMSACQLYTQDYREDVLEYAMIADSGDLSQLDEYPNLEYVDLRGSVCYDEILEYAASHPNVTVRYNVQLGEKRYDQDVTELSLNCYESNYDLLLQNLKYLPNLRNVHLNQVDFSREQYDALISTYPGITFTHTVELCGRRYDSSVTELDLAHLTGDDLDDIIRTVSLLPDLTFVDLANDIGESSLSIEDVKMLQDTFPTVSFRYEFNLFGQKVSTIAEELVFDSVEIGNDGVEEIRNALQMMKQCTYVKLDSCGIDNDVMAQLRSDYPDITVVWRVFAGKYSILTDEEMLRMPNTLKDKDTEGLVYCNKIKYLDISSSSVSNIDFVASMPELECAIFSLSQVKDISPLADCPNLVWLELSGCYGLKDLSPLSGHQNLKYLNVSNTKVSDLTVLDEVPLERFNCVKSAAKGDSLEAFKAKHPDCLTVSTGSVTGYGWRYDDKAQTQPFSYYLHIREVFRYDDKSFKGNRKES